MGILELWILALILIVVGLVGTVIPGLPGMPLVLGGVAVFAIGTGFNPIGPLQFVGFLLLGLLGIGLELLGNLIGARKFGASRMGLLGALVGLLPGILLAGPFGLVIGPLIGAVAFELFAGREARAALRSGFGVLVGFLFGTLAESVLALIIAVWFFISTAGAATAGGLPRP